MLCDSPGLDEKEEAGLCIDDIPHILKGCIPDRYQLTRKPITPSHSTFITSPSLKERIHCVAYVLDVNSVNHLPCKMVKKFKRVQKEVLHLGIAHVALLTKVDNWDEILQDNFLNMNRSMTYESQIMYVSKMLTIPISNILMVGNYASECELNPFKDVLILSVLRQMLRATDDFLEDLPLE
ncbi:LOW QUALITY PROTEIN: interferon-induced protein 44-like [Dugong dugon]